MILCGKSNEQAALPRRWCRRALWNGCLDGAQGVCGGARFMLERISRIMRADSIRFPQQISDSKGQT
jgi:hypothetical protein